MATLYEVVVPNRHAWLEGIQNELKRAKAAWALIRFQEDLQRLDWRLRDYGEAARITNVARRVNENSKTWTDHRKY